MLRYNIGNLSNKTSGARVNFEISDPVFFEGSDEPRLISPVTGEVQLLKLPHEINVQIRNIHTSASCACARCLVSFVCPIDVPFAEREFLIDLPLRELEVGEDVYYVDKSTNEIDTEEMIKTEILLHFPAIPVCSESCKGLCDKCGANLNLIYGQAPSTQKEGFKCAHSSTIRGFCV